MASKQDLTQSLNEFKGNDEESGKAFRIIGNAGGFSSNPSDSFTRPDNTTQYASGDLIANSAIAGSVAPLEFVAARYSGASFIITRARLHKDDADITASTFRLHLFKADPTGTAPTGGDNAAIELNGIDAGEYIGYFDFDMTSSPDILADGIELAAAPANGTNITVDPTASSVYGLLEARDTYTPAAEEVFTVTLEVLQD